MRPFCSSCRRIHFERGCQHVSPFPEDADIPASYDAVTGRLQRTAPGRSSPVDEAAGAAEVEHSSALALADVHEAQLLQPLQRLSQRLPVHAEALAEDPLGGEALSRVQRAAEDAAVRGLRGRDEAVRAAARRLGERAHEA